ncbi:MAG: methyltransferase domain-containing protein [Candidatus Bathyarchaeota archaeon]|nr:methyltransferase domain-containing protein [Candidatus Bathyarchaeota archaeon]
MTDCIGNYSWNAEEYAKQSSNQYEWAMELIPKLNLTGTEALLDIGCGDGKITAVLASYLPHGKVVGIDSSEDMIALARRTFPQSQYPNLSFMRMDARELTFREQFDVVFSNATLHWIIDHPAVLSGVHDSLDSHGQLLFQMAGEGNAQDVLAVLQEMISEDTCEPYFKNFTFPYGFYNPNQYKQWLQEAGFTPKRAELIPKDMVLNGKEGLVGWIRTTWLPFTERVPASLQEQFINEVADRYIAAYPPDNKGKVHVNMVRLEVQAVKK